MSAGRRSTANATSDYSALAGTYLAGTKSRIAYPHPISAFDRAATPPPLGFFYMAGALWMSGFDRAATPLPTSVFFFTSLQNLNFFPT